MRVANILETIGRTPHVRLQRLFPAPAEVWLKLERANPGGSIKAVSYTHLDVYKRQLRLPFPPCSEPDRSWRPWIRWMRGW